jgi:DNA-directed RNA polymerase specialized sigma24 family protein
MRAVSDDALLADLATGDSDAAVAFVQRFQRRVFSLVATIVGDPRAAEDIAQDAFVRAWGHAGACSRSRGTSPSTRSGCDGPSSSTPDSILALNLSEAGPLPDELATLRDDADRLCAALAQLPPEQRRALVMSGLLGHTVREVTEAEDIPLGTAQDPHSHGAAASAVGAHRGTRRMRANA